MIRQYETGWRRGVTVAFMVGGLAMAPNAARAGCCDDFFSCLGAVATLGASCAVEALTSAAANEALRPHINKLKSIIDDGRKELDQAAQDRQKLADDMQAEIGAGFDTAKQQTGKSLDRAEIALTAATSPMALAPPKSSPARALAPASPAGAPSMAKAPDGGAMARAPTNVRPGMSAADAAAPAFEPTADPARVRHALEYSLKEVQKNKTETEGLASKNNASLKGLPGAAQVGSKELSSLNENTVVKEINAQIQKMEEFIKHPLDPTKLPPLIEGIAKSIVLISNNQGAQLEARAKEVDDQLAQRVGNLKNAEGQASDMSKHSDGVAGQMEKVAEKPTVKNVEKLEKLAGMPRFNPAKKLITVKRVMSEKTARYVGNMRLIGGKFGNEMPGQTLPGARPTQAAMLNYRTRVQGDLAQMFAGKTGPTAKSQLDALRAEASRRFASDPKTRDAVLRYLDNETSRYQPNATAVAPGFRAPTVSIPAASRPAPAPAGSQLPAIQQPATQLPAVQQPAVQQQMQPGRVRSPGN